MLTMDDADRHVLEQLADREIRKVLTQGGVLTSVPTGEVSAVETMTLDGFAEIARAWEPFFSGAGYTIDLRAVFVHSRPWVSWKRADKSQGRCELADLLVVVDHLGATGALQRQAVLIQAKLLKGGAFKLAGSEWVQFELLGEWPRFTFASPGYDPLPRDFKVQERLSDEPRYSAEYGGIDLAAGAWVQELFESNGQLGKRISFGRLLAGMIVGAPSFGRGAYQNGGDPWSFTIDELLRVTGALPITKAKALNRGVSNPVGMFVAVAAHGPATLSAAASHGDDGIRKPPKVEGSGEPGGVSTIRLIFTHKDRRSDDVPDEPADPADVGHP